MKSEFLSENFQFLVVKVSIYLSRPVFVMDNFRKCIVTVDHFYTSDRMYLHEISNLHQTLASAATDLSHLCLLRPVCLNT